MKSKKTILIVGSIFIVASLCVAALCIAAATMTTMRGELDYLYINPGPIKTIDQQRTVTWPELPFIIPGSGSPFFTIGPVPPFFKVWPMPPFFIIGKKPFLVTPWMMGNPAEGIKITSNVNVYPIGPTK